MFYFENVAEVEATGEEKARAVISYLRGPAFSFYLGWFTNRGELREEAKEYEVEKNALREE